MQVLLPEQMLEKVDRIVDHQAREAGRKARICNRNSIPSRSSVLRNLIELGLLHYKIEQQDDGVVNAR